MTLPVLQRVAACSHQAERRLKSLQWYWSQHLHSVLNPWAPRFAGPCSIDSNRNLKSLFKQKTMFLEGSWYFCCPNNVLLPCKLQKDLIPSPVFLSPPQHIQNMMTNMHLLCTEALDVREAANNQTSQVKRKDVGTNSFSCNCIYFECYILSCIYIRMYTLITRKIA